MRKAAIFTYENNVGQYAELFPYLDKYCVIAKPLALVQCFGAKKTTTDSSLNCTRISVFFEVTFLMILECNML